MGGGRSLDWGEVTHSATLTRENSTSKTQASDERTAPTSSYPHDINEESTTAAKWPLNRAQPV